MFDPRKAQQRDDTYPKSWHFTPRTILTLPLQHQTSGSKTTAPYPSIPHFLSSEYGRRTPKETNEVYSKRAQYMYRTYQSVYHGMYRMLAKVVIRCPRLYPGLEDE